MKPNNFVFNTDYLSLAQTNKVDLTAIFAAETFPAGQAHNRYQDLTVSSSQGAIDRVLISRNGGDYIIGSNLTISTFPDVQISVYRTSPTNLRVRLHVFTNQTGGYSMPMQTLSIKLTSFKPPNIF